MVTFDLKGLYRLLFKRGPVVVRGFTLVEAAVALAAVAAVIVVSMGGAAVVNRTKLGSIITDIQSFSKAADGFEAKYNGLPGDIVTVPSIAGRAGAGNGNGAIDTTTEALQFWQDLTLSGFLKGKYDGTSTNVPGTGVPKGPLDNSGYNVFIPTSTSGITGQALVIEFSGFTSSSNSRAILSPEDALSIDKKMDDGKPNTGSIRAIDSANDNSTTECVTGGMAATATYNAGAATSKTLGCRLRFIIRGSNEAQTVTLSAGATLPCTQPGITRISPTPGNGCPANTYGHVIETCKFDSSNAGNWIPTEYHCQPVLCQGSKKPGEKRILPCASGWKGAGVAGVVDGIVQTCSSEGVWKTDLTDPDGAGSLTNGVHCVVDTTSSSAACTTAGDTRAAQSCNWGQMGSVTGQTCSGTFWSSGTSSCTHASCAGTTINSHVLSLGYVDDAAPQTVTGGCTDASSSGLTNVYTGNFNYSCTLNGWQITSNSCAPVHPTSACTAGVTADKDLGCPPGEAPVNSALPANLYRCTATNTWTPVSNQCAPITCSGERLGATRVVNGATCANGALGQVIEVCTNVSNVGTWVAPSTQPLCATAMCTSNDGLGNATWAYSPVAGAAVTAASCLPGYTGTLPTRLCNASGSGAAWGAVTGGCTRTSCPTSALYAENATWTNPYSKSYNVVGKCSWPNYEGTPLRDCDLNPTVGSTANWSSASKPACQPSALPVLDSLKLWLDANDGSSLYTDTTCATQVTTSGNTVKCWQDKSGYANNATGNAAATYIANSSTMNYKPVLRFNGNSNYLDLPTSGIFGASGNTNPGNVPHSVFIVTNPTAFVNTSGVAGGGNLTGLLSFGFNGNNTANVFRFNSDGSAANYWWNNDLNTTAGDFTAGSSYVISTIYNGTSRTLYGNAKSLGTLASSALNLTTTTQNRVGFGCCAEFMYGDIAEVAVYNRALSTPDQQAVEKYLGAKWGIKLAPTLPAGIVQQLDAYDTTNLRSAGVSCSNAVGGSGGTMGCWIATVGTSMRSFTGTKYYGNALNTHGGNYFNGTSSSSPTSGNSYTAALNPTDNTLFLVATPNGTSGLRTAWSSNNAGKTIGYSIGIDASNYWQGSYGTGSAWTTISSGVQATSPAILSYAFKTGKQAFYVNGANYGLSSGTYSINNATNVSFIGAGNAAGSEFFNGYIHELILYNSYLSDTNRSTVEAYLSGKWGINLLNSQIPVTAGMVLWLDGNDISTMWTTSDCTTTRVTASGNSVGCWQDKSRIGNNATQATGGNQPVYTTNIINSKPVVRFTSSSNNYMTSPVNIDYASMPNSTIFTVYQNRGGGGYQSLWGGDNGGYDRFAFTSGYCSLGSGTSFACVPMVGNTATSLILTAIMKNGVSNGSTGWLNGTLGVTYTENHNSGDSTTIIGNAGSAGITYGQYANADIAEMNIYYRALSTQEKCDMETYYGLKWGIAVDTCPVTGAPTVAGGLQLWLDASDGATVFTDPYCINGQYPANASSIGCWKDKSGKKNHATQLTSANRPSYIKNGQNSNSILRFDGASDYLTAPSSLLNSMSSGTATGSTVFIVAKTTTVQNSSIFNSYADIATQKFGFTAPWGDGNIYWDNGDNSVNGRQSVAWGGSTGTTYVWSMNTSGTTSQNIWRNGTNIATKGSSELTAYGTTYTLDIGAGGGRANFFAGDIDEILIYNRSLLTKERQMVEYALSNKWNVTLNTPVTGPQLWLDAADSSTLFTNADCATGGTPANNATIGCWKDKSGYGRNAVSGVAPTYKTNIINSLPVIRFNGSSTYLEAPTSVLNSMSLYNASGTTAFIVAKDTTVKASSVISQYPDVGNPRYNIHLPYADGTAYWDFGNISGGGRISTAWGGSVGTAYVWTFNANGTTSQNIWRNGTNIATNASANTPSFGTSYNFEIGTASRAAGAWYDGDIGEIILYNTAVSDNDRISTQRYLGAKWGVTVP